MPTRVLSKGGGGVDGIYCGGGRFFVGKKGMLKDVREEEEDGKIGLVEKNICYSEEESSSIGKNSDLSENSVEKCGDGEEVQSSYKGPLASMEALEEVLPMRRGISRFYKGKSKSFASLGDASSSSSSSSSIAKPENAYMRRRRNMVALSSPLSLRSNGGGIAKRVTSSNSSSSRATLALAVAISNGSSPPAKNFSSSWRSFSLADFQQLR